MGFFEMKDKDFISILEATKKSPAQVSVRGWVLRERGSNMLKFIILRDSSGIIQCVLDRKKFDKRWNEIDKLQVETSLKVTGRTKEDKRAPTGFEITVDEIEIVGISDKFPINKDLNEKLLGDRRHLWLRSRKMVAVLKIRSSILFALHSFFRRNKFIEVEAPSFTGSTSEGGSTTFEVPYFGKKAYLTQSWQFYAENIINAVERAYAIAPSFRAEKSKTTRHLTEFWHCEAEAAWVDMEELMSLARDCLSFVLNEVINENLSELQILEIDVDRLIKKNYFSRITYREAIDTLIKKGY